MAAYKKDSGQIDKMYILYIGNDKLGRNCFEIVLEEIRWQELRAV